MSSKSRFVLIQRGRLRSAGQRHPRLQERGVGAGSWMLIDVFWQSRSFFHAKVKKSSEKYGLPSLVLAAFLDVREPTSSAPVQVIGWT